MVPRLVLQQKFMQNWNFFIVYFIRETFYLLVVLFCLSFMELVFLRNFCLPTEFWGEPSKQWAPWSLYPFFYFSRLFSIQKIFTIPLFVLLFYHPGKFLNWDYTVAHFICLMKDIVCLLVGVFVTQPTVQIVKFISAEIGLLTLPITFQFFCNGNLNCFAIYDDRWLVRIVDLTQQVFDIGVHRMLTC